MEKIDNIQKEEIAGDPTLKETPSESEYETETDDEVFLWERYWFNDVTSKCLYTAYNGKIRHLGSVVIGGTR